MAAELFEAVPELAALWWENEDGNRRLLHDRRLHKNAGSPGASFAQVNEAVAAELRAHVIELVTARSPRSVIDAYSGAGEVAVELARFGAESYGDRARCRGRQLVRKPPSRRIGVDSRARRIRVAVRASC
jgi:hypothetical protein